ncbi:hypothetical protein ACN28S_07320 [Cystobacter fuscus]
MLDYSKQFAVGTPQSVGLDEGGNLWLLDGEHGAANPVPQSSSSHAWASFSASSSSLACALAAAATTGVTGAVENNAEAGKWMSA